jgi:hypothetical protein
MPWHENRRLVAEQNASYRRGVVLGLTMAEAGILIIFVLLLLIGFNEWVEARDRELASGKSLVERSRLDQLQQKEQQLNAVTNALQVRPTASEEEIQAMVRAVVQAADTPTGQSALTQVKDALSQIERIKQELRDSNHPEALLTTLEKQAFTLSNQEGQLKYYETKLQEAGAGKGERPCWVDPNGTIEFLFDVVLSSEGIRMREVSNPTRTKERGALPVPETDEHTILTPAEFTRRTVPLYESSLAANCRFFVRVFDATGPTEKDLYKSLLHTVEAHFFKRLSVDAAPF